jgi:hypothetical protein
MIEWINAISQLVLVIIALFTAFITWKQFRVSQSESREARMGEAIPQLTSDPPRVEPPSNNDDVYIGEILKLIKDVNQQRLNLLHGAPNKALRGLLISAIVMTLVAVLIKWLGSFALSLSSPMLSVVMVVLILVMSFISFRLAVTRSINRSFANVREVEVRFWREFLVMIRSDRFSPRMAGLLRQRMNTITSPAITPGFVISIDEVLFEELSRKHSGVT